MTETDRPLIDPATRAANFVQIIHAHGMRSQYEARMKLTKPTTLRQETYPCQPTLLKW